MSPSETLVAFLAASGRPFEVIEHVEARSAVEAAAARGTPLEIGGKTVVMKIDKIGYSALVVGSHRRIEGRLLRKALHVQRYRFASREELVELEGLSPGEIPPIGRPLFPVELFVGRDLVERPEIAFAAAAATRSIRMATADWLAIANPTVVETFTVADE